MVGGPISGASMNPARSLGPALVANDFNGLWIYLAAPIIGGAIAALVYWFLRDEKS
jgi:glycerol uptake facilitator-like aquaporin